MSQMRALVREQILGHAYFSWPRPFATPSSHMVRFNLFKSCLAIILTKSRFILEWAKL